MTIKRVLCKRMKCILYGFYSHILGNLFSERIGSDRHRQASICFGEFYLANVNKDWQRYKS